MSLAMNEGRISASFACQRCLRPLKLDDSLGSLNEHTLADLSRK